MSMQTEFTDPVLFLQKIISIESISGNEAQLSHFLIEFLKFHGFSILPSELGNAVGIKGSGVPILLLSSHIDTVPTKNPFRTEGGRIFGMGAVDCKPSLASMFFSAATTEWKENQGTIILAGIVQEEISHLGMKDYFKNGLTPEYAIFGEPTTETQICVGYKGRLLVRIEITSDTGHAACCWQYDNPAELSIIIFNKIKELETKIKSNNQNQEPQTKFQELSVVLTNIIAESSDNTIPNTCTFSIDIRIPPKITTHDLKASIENIIEETKKSHLINNNTRIVLQILSEIESCESDPNNLLPNALRWAIFKTTEKKPVFVKKTGTSFTNLIAAHYDIPVITYGPGDPKLEHSDAEFIEIEEYLRVIEIYRKFFGKFTELYRKVN